MGCCSTSGSMVQDAACGAGWQITMSFLMEGELEVVTLSFVLF